MNLEGLARADASGAVDDLPAACVALALVLAHVPRRAAPRARRACLSECTPRIGIVSAFGAEADILVARDARARSLDDQRQPLHDRRRCAATAVVIVLSGVSMVNAAMTTQRLLDHFRIERLVMSGIAGGIDPSHHVGDVLVPEAWAMPMECTGSHDASLPAPCGAPGDLSCLGLAHRRGRRAGRAAAHAAGRRRDGLFMRENHATRPAAGPRASSCFDYRVDPGDARRREDDRAGAGAHADPKATRASGAAPDPQACASAAQPTRRRRRARRLGTAFLANPAYRRYLFEQLRRADASTWRRAALAHVALRQRRSLHRAFAA